MTDVYKFMKDNNIPNVSMVFTHITENYPKEEWFSRFEYAWDRYMDIGDCYAKDKEIHECMYNYSSVMMGAMWTVREMNDL